MGFDISWVAFQGTPKDRILEKLGARDTGEADAFYGAELAGADLPNGWFVLYANDSGYASPQRLASLSADCRIVACQVDEAEMASCAVSYDHGREVWRVAHDLNRGAYDLSISGSPPPALELIRRRLTQQQDNGAEYMGMSVDYVFDIPVEMAAAEVCGFRHDRARFDWGEPRFTGLKPVDALASGNAAGDI